MAIWAIGDVQGCYDPLRRLLDEIRFDPEHDTLWFCGDLVNRGPKSLKALRFVQGLGEAAVSVLGNHDLHLLALASDAIPYDERFRTLRKTLDAPDIGDIVAWLRRLPMLHFDAQLDTLLVHAGIHPAWRIKNARKLANEVEAALQGKHYKQLLAKMYGNTPRAWSPDLKSYRRLRFAINVFTRMRMMTAKGNLNFSWSGNPFRARKNLQPWFNIQPEKPRDTRLVFGHWSALGVMVLPQLICLDSGCVWGGQLTAVRMDKKLPRIVQVAG